MWTDEMRRMRCGSLTQVTAPAPIFVPTDYATPRPESAGLNWTTPDGPVLPILDPPYFKHILKSFAMSISLSSVFNLCAQLMPKSQSSPTIETLMAWPVPAQWRYDHKYLQLEDHTMKFAKVSFWLLGIALVALFIAACGGAAPQAAPVAP